MHAEYRPFKYEQLVDLTNYVEKGMWATSTDCTSGFHHLSLHPDMWEYAGFMYDGQYYVFTVPAFGLAPVPRIYTSLMEEVYLRVREAGVPMTFMIDDQANWAHSEGQAKAQCSALVRLLATLGFYLRPDKCQLRPMQLVRFLGLVTDAAELVFRVPDDKLQRFLAEARALLGEGSPTPRMLARLAGQLLSFTPAVDMAPLLARGLFHILKGKASGGWDLGFDTNADLVAALSWCVEAVPRYNGTRMMKRGTALQLQLAGDASEVGGAPACFLAPTEPHLQYRHCIAGR